MRANLDLAHIGYIELYTHKPDESLRFFTHLLSFEENGTKDDSVYLRAWDDYEQFSLKLTARDAPGIGRVGLRAVSPEALKRRVSDIEALGLGDGWRDGEPGRGHSYDFRTPDGHNMQLYYDTDWYEPPPKLQPALKNQAHRRPNHGIGVRRLDHVNYLAADVPANRDFTRDVLGGRPTEQIVLDNGSTAGVWFSVTNKGYDIVFTNDWTGTPGRLHHIAVAVDQREDILRGADLFLEDGVHIETGPHKHAIQQTFFLYVWEPAGNRIEIVNAGARLVLAPDWPVVTWTEAERATGQAWGLKTIESFHTHGTPPVDVS